MPAGPRAPCAGSSWSGDGPSGARMPRRKATASTTCGPLVQHHAFGALAHRGVGHLGAAGLAIFAPCLPAPASPRPPAPVPPRKATGFPPGSLTAGQSRSPPPDRRARSSRRPAATPPASTIRSGRLRRPKRRFDLQHDARAAPPPGRRARCIAAIRAIAHPPPSARRKTTPYRRAPPRNPAPPDHRGQGLDPQVRSGQVHALFGLDLAALFRRARHLQHRPRPIATL